MRKNKKMLSETRIRWTRLAGVIDGREERRRLDEAKTAFPGNEIELEENAELEEGEQLDEMDMDTRDQNNRLYELDDEVPMGDEMGGDLGGGDDELADVAPEDDLGGDDLGMDDEMGDIGGGDEALAAEIITAVTDAISSVLGVDTEVDTEYEDDLEMDYEEPMGDEMPDDLGAEPVGDEMGPEDELMEELENSINPSGGKVDHAGGGYYDHKLKDEPDHLKNSINEGYADQLAESVVRKLAKYLKPKK